MAQPESTFYLGQKDHKLKLHHSDHALCRLPEILKWNHTIMDCITHPKILFFIVCCSIFSAVSCTPIADNNQQNQSITEMCEKLQTKRTLKQADSLMVYFARLETQWNSGQQRGAGNVVYWRTPSDSKIILEEPMRLVIPHGETCKVEYNQQKELSQINYRFISEDDYQQQLKKTQENS